MIIAITGLEGNSAVSDLAEDLAMLRVAAGRRVLLVGPRPGPYNQALYDDLVIDASHCDDGTDAALARAAVIIALVRSEELEQRDHDALLERLRGAQRANPGARMLVTVAHGSEPLSPHQAGCLLVFVARIPGASLADMLELDAQGAYRSHCSELELDARKTAFVLCAPEVRHLYGEVFRGGPARMYR